METLLLTALKMMQFGTKRKKKLKMQKMLQTISTSRQTVKARTKSSQAQTSGQMKRFFSEPINLLKSMVNIVCILFI